MYKVIIFIIAIVLAVAVGFGIFFAINKSGDSRITNDEAAKAKEGRYLTIINDTKQIINDVHITVGEGIEIESAYQENPDEKSYSVPILNDYDDYNEFTVTFIDRYEITYQKMVTFPKVTKENKNEKFTIEVKITKDDYVKQKGDWKRKIDRLFNGD